MALLAVSQLSKTIKNDIPYRFCRTDSFLMIFLHHLYSLVGIVLLCFCLLTIVFMIVGLLRHMIDTLIQ